MITGCALLANLSSVAQNASAETKPVKSTLKAEAAVSSAPAPAQQTLQKSSEPQNASPIVAGGEFKPRDTNTALPADRSKKYDEPKPVVLNTAASNASSSAPASEAAKKEPAKSQAKVVEQKQ